MVIYNDIVDVMVASITNASFYSNDLAFKLLCHASTQVSNVSVLHSHDMAMRNVYRIFITYIHRT